jgi:hypothetical protein
MNANLKALVARYMKCRASDVTSEKTLKELGAQDWQIIEMAMEFETLFKVPMDADKAIALKKVSDWEELIPK